MEEKKALINLKLKVCERQCDQCLFGKNRIVTLARKKDILKQCIEGDQHFECHKGTMAGLKIVCRGFYNQMTSSAIQISQRMGWIEFVDPFTELLKTKQNEKTLR